MLAFLSFIIQFAVRAMLSANDLSTSFDQHLAVRFLSKYGHFAILLAAFWEGEAVLITAGTLCGAGYLDWRLTILAAAIGGSAGDQIYFYIARERAARAINKSKRLRKWYPRGLSCATAPPQCCSHASLPALELRFRWCAPLLECQPASTAF